MKKLILALALCASLAGCAGQSVLVGGTSINAPITNPVTPAMLYDIENGFSTAVAGLLTYRRLCLAGKADTHCRSNIQRIQVYTRLAKPLILQLRTFVRNNDQISAVSVLTELRGILQNVLAIRNSIGAV